MWRFGERRFGWIGWSLTALAAIAVGPFAVAWSGLYSVAATKGHWVVVERFLEFGMRNSVATHSLGIVAPPLDDPDMVRLGASHFHAGCAYCHGAPGTPISPVAAQMLPAPPDLSGSNFKWKDRELFWIVQNGMKYTGMPGWVATQRHDEIWTVVAFLKRLPHLDPRAYRDLALGPVQIVAQTGRQMATAESNADALGACARFHGAEGQPPASRLVPVLHGQSAEFLLGALQAYAAGARQSGIMQPVASDLQPEAMQRLSRYYAGLQAPRGRPALSASDGAITAGKVLAENGQPENEIPACVACHIGNILPAYPRLAGQSGRYMAGQLRVWKSGANAASGPAEIMAPIARRLSEQQIDDVSAYFASLAPQLPASP